MQITIRRILATLLLLCIAQGAQAMVSCPNPLPVGLTSPPEADFGPVGPGAYSLDCEVPDSDLPNVALFNFVLEDVFAVELRTESRTVDTVLGLFELNEATNIYWLRGENDDCIDAVDGESCLSFSGLQPGKYLAMISDWFMFFDDFNFFADSFPASDLSSALTANRARGGGDVTLNLNVSPVPVPAAVWLFGSALLGFVGMARRTSIKS